MPSALRSTVRRSAPPERGSGEIDSRRGHGRARDDEAARQLDLLSQRVDVPFERVRHLRGHDAEVLLQLRVVGAVGGEFRANGEELALEAKGDALHFRVGGEGACEAERRDGFVGGAVGLGAWIVLEHASTVQQAGLAGVAVSRVHPHRPSLAHAADYRTPKGREGGNPLPRSRGEGWGGGLRALGRTPAPAKAGISQPVLPPRGRRPEGAERAARGARAAHSSFPRRRESTPPPEGEGQGRGRKVR